MNGTIDYTTLENEIIKLDTGSRANVQFKPSKKMKKRRQLDALVSNGKKLPRRKQSGHELLRSNDSESSELEEFSVLESPKWGKRWSNQGCCSTCYTFTCILIVASCLLACATLIWMHLELKRDFNDLRHRMELVENKNAGTPEEFQALQSKLMVVNKTVHDIKTGKSGLEVLNRSIVSMQKEITSLAATAAQLQESVQSTDSGDKEQMAVANTVADLGSGLQSTKTDVESLKSSQKTFTTQLENLGNRVFMLENPGGREGGSSASDTQDVQALLSQINATFTQSIGLAEADLNRQQAHMDALDKYMQGLQDQVQNVSQQVANLTQSQQRLEANVLQQMTGKKQANTGMEDESSQTESPLSLVQLQSQMQDLQRKLEQMPSDYRNLTYGGAAVDSSSSTGSDSDIQALKKDHEEFVVFRTEVFQDISSLNSSLVSVNGSVSALNTDVGELFAKVSLAMTEISNVTTVVEGLTNFLHTKMAGTSSVAEGGSPEGKLTTAGKKPQQAAEDGKVSEDLKSTTAQPESAQPTQPSDSSGKETVNLGDDSEGKVSEDLKSTTAQP